MKYFGRSAPDASSMLKLLTRQNFLNTYHGAILSRLTGSQQRLRAIRVKNPLASSSLLASFLRHKIIRKHESAEMMQKRIFRLLGPRNKIWTAIDPVVAKKELLDSTISSLKYRLYLTSTKAEAQRNVLEDTLEYLTNLQRMQQSESQEDRMVSLYPQTGNLASIRGMAVQIAGPKRDTKASTKKKMIGSSSINSVGLVAAEKAQIQLPSKLGVYGLKLIISYCKQDRLANTKTEASPLTIPGYKSTKVFGFSEEMNPVRITQINNEKRLCSYLDAV